jgi:hypothetical protein
VLPFSIFLILFAFIGFIRGQNPDLGLFALIRVIRGQNPFPG